MEQQYIPHILVASNQHPTLDVVPFTTQNRAPANLVQQPVHVHTALYS